MAKRSGVTAPKGFLAAGSHCGVKSSGAKDLAIILSDRPAITYGVLTKNLVKAAPVVVSREHLRSPYTRAIVINSGNANVLAQNDYENAKRMVMATAECLKIPERQILVASTGKISAPLPIEKIERGICNLTPYLRPGGGSDAAEAIMTTDLVKKEAAVKLAIGSKQVVVGGCAKGSGMIHPNMATMLAFIMTDATVTRPVLKDIVKRSNEASFSRVTVDGDTSTNDMYVLMANGASGAAPIEKPSGKNYSKLLDKVTEVCVTLAKEMARDGEGATKFITVEVTGAKTETAAIKVAMSVAKSSLVKTAMFGEDPNWGRIMAAVGYAGVPVELSAISLKMCGVTLYKKGEPANALSEAKVAAKMKKKDITISIDLGAGKATTQVWTCDMSYDYVRINAEYST